MASTDHETGSSAGQALSIRPPDLHQPLIPASRYAPSWSGTLSETPFLSAEHRAIFEIVRAAPGWQDAADSHKLYEVAYHNGSVILEIGVDRKSTRLNSSHVALY